MRMNCNGYSCFESLVFYVPLPFQNVMAYMHTLSLLIETSGRMCSCALADGDTVVALEQAEEPNAHSAKLAVLVDTLFRTTGFKYPDLSFVALSIGPGSYTGLRIGASSVKGFAYALDIPVVAVPTPLILAKAAADRHPGSYVLTMIDARRMEVYSNIFDPALVTVKDCSADVLTEDIYDGYLSGCDSVVLVGDGASKTRVLFGNKPNYHYDDAVELSAGNMAVLAHEKFLKKEFEAVAYFEPFYLKSFVAVRSQVKGLY